MAGGAENPRPSVWCLMQGSGGFERVFREAGVGSVVSVTAFSGHAVPGPGVGTLDHSKSPTGLWWLIRLKLALHIPLRFCFS